MRRSLICLFATALAFPLTGHAAEESWQTYVNARFGTFVEVPVQIFSTAGEQAENGDGATFKSADGDASLAVWAFYAQEDDFPNTLLGIARDRPGLTKSAQTKNGYWISGASNGVEYYEKCLFGASSDRIVHCVKMEYPKAQRVVFRAHHARIAASLGGP